MGTVKTYIFVELWQKIQVLLRLELIKIQYRIGPNDPMAARINSPLDWLLKWHTPALKDGSSQESHHIHFEEFLA